jgi:hypothetical protein
VVLVSQRLLDAPQLFFNLLLFAGEKRNIFLEVHLDHFLQCFVLLLQEEDFFFELLLGV